VVWITHFMMFWISSSGYGWVIFLFLATFLYFLLTAERHATQLREHLIEAGLAFFGLIYLGILPLFFVELRGHGDGAQWVLLTLFIIWSGDTGAYFAGKKYGQRKLYPVISPKKTVEGLIGGILAGVVVTWIFKFTGFRNLSWSGALLIPLVLGAVAALGDLCESFVKRAFDTKDSGSILPGHGGMLDRFDGVVFSLPVAYACMKIWG
jgi:phosphatidate cytidylyltransferase